MKTNVQIPVIHDHEVHISENEDYDKVVLLLHGFQLNGYFMYKRFAPLFDEKTKVISPNAPFIIPLQKGNDWEARYSWYYYHSQKKNFYINYEPAANWLKELTCQFNQKKAPVTIIGYSQGGYLAPKAAELIEECDKVIGINSVFRSERFEFKDRVQYNQINGSLDKVVSPEEAKQEFGTLISKGAKGDFSTVAEDHLLNRNLVQVVFNKYINE